MMTDAEFSEMWRLHACANHLCDRQTTAMYCCAGCDMADQGKYEIHNDGTFLSHSLGCDERHAARSKR